MENRKVVKLGRSTLVVSLPKYWVKLAGLNSGDVISLVSQKDGSLALYSKDIRQEDQREIVLYINPDESEGILTRKIVACYLNGYSTIRLCSKKMFTLEQQHVIREVSGKTYLRIIEAHSREVLLQSLTDLSKVPVDKGIQRTHFITASMLQDALKALEEKNGELANIVCSLDDDVDQFSILLLRLIRSAALNLTLANVMGLEPIDCLEYQTVIQRIEHVADQAVVIARNIPLLSDKAVSKSLLEVILTIGYESYRVYDKAVKAFLNRDLVSANEVIDLQAKINELDQKAAMFLIAEERSIDIACAISSIRESIRRIAEFGKDIAKTAIDRAMYTTEKDQFEGKGKAVIRLPTAEKK